MEETKLPKCDECGEGTAVLYVRGRVQKVLCSKCNEKCGDSQSRLEELEAEAESLKKKGDRLEAESVKRSNTLNQAMTDLETENAKLRGLIEERVQEWDTPSCRCSECSDGLIERMRDALKPAPQDSPRTGGEGE